MRLIHVDIDTMRDSRLSPNFNGVMDSFKTFMSEGYVVQIVQEATNQPVLNLFQINDFEEFNKWVEKGCSSSR